METKTVVLTVILGAGMLFTGCEKEVAQSPANSNSADFEIVKRSNLQHKNGLLSESELEDYVIAMENETAITITTISTNQFLVQSVPFTLYGLPDNLPSSNSVWPNNRANFWLAWAEYQELGGKGCATIECRYGMIAVNALEGDDC